MKKKVAPHDFTNQSLPSTRWKQFFFLLKNNYNKFILIGLILFAFLLPFLVSELFQSLRISSLYKSFNSNLSLAADQATRDQLAASYQSDYLSIRRSHLWINGILLVLFSIGLSGVTRILRQLCFMEPVFFREDFVKGIKQNALHYFISFVFIAILYMLSSYIRVFAEIDELFRYFPLLITTILFVPILSLVMAETTIYQEKYFKLLGNAFYIGFRYFFINVGISFLFYIPFIFLLLAESIAGYWFLVFYLFAIIYILVILPTAILLYYLHALKSFDDCINRTNYPTIVRKGLSKENTDV